MRKTTARRDLAIVMRVIRGEGYDGGGESEGQVMVQCALIGRWSEADAVWLAPHSEHGVVMERPT